MGINVSTIAQTGTYTVNVSQLAQAQLNTSSNFTSASSTVIADPPPATLLNPAPIGPLFGSVALQVGSGPTVTFNVNKSTTLSQLADAINASSLGPQVTATVVNDSNGYRLNLAGDNTGSANAITITETDTKLNLNKNKLVTAQNALGSVNGLSFSDATNTDNTAIEGVTMSFNAITGAPVTIQVFKDNVNLANRVQTFVMNYNTTLKAINAATAYSPVTNFANLLSDSGLQGFSNMFSKAIMSAPASASGNYRTLADAGVSVNTDDGTLQVDVGALTTAIGKDASSIANLLSNTTRGTGIAQTIDKMAAAFGGPTGVFAALSRAQADLANDQTQAAADMQYSIDAQQTSMQNKFVRYEVSMSRLTTQNLLLQALISSSGNGATSTSNQNFTINAPVDDDATMSSSLQPTPEQIAASAYGNSSASTTSGPVGLNGYVPASRKV